MLFMISVQNLLQPLSGNNGMRIRSLLFFILLIIISGCSTRKKAQTSAPVVTAPAPVIKDTTAQVKTEPKEKPKKVYTLHVLLPLDLTAHFVDDSLPESSPLIEDETIPSLHFYEGVLAAVDSLSSDELEIKIHVIDIPSDSVLAAQVLRTSFRKCDAAIAWINSSLYETAVTQAQKEHCRLIVPGASNTQLLKLHPDLWFAGATNSTQLATMSSFVNDRSKGTNLYIINRDQKPESILSGFIAERIDSLAGKAGACQKILYKKETWNTSKAKFSNTKNNYVIIPTSDESFLSAVLNKLDELEGYQFTLIGLPTWENFEAVDPERLRAFNTMIFNSTFIDPDNARINRFRKAFLDVNHTDALPQAYQAYDILQYLVNNYKLFANDAAKYKPQPSMLFPVSGMQFSKVCEGCGAENKVINVLQYGDYKLLRIAEYQR